MSQSDFSGPINITGPIPPPTVAGLMNGPFNCSDANWRNSKIAKFHVLGGTDTGGGLLGWTNPEQTDVLITQVLANVTTIATGVCTIQVGTTSTSLTTASNNLLDALDVHAAAGVFNLIDDKGAGGKTRQILSKGKFLTASQKTGATAGLVMDLYIEYVPV